MLKILGIGNALVDVLVPATDEMLLRQGLLKGGMTLIGDDEWEALGRQLEGMDTQRATGGSAANTVLALALLGDVPGLIGTVGDDEWGRYLVRTAAERGIKAHLRVAEGSATGVATTFITPDSERTFATHLGAASMLDTKMITPELMHGYDILHIEGYLVQNHELTDHIARTAKAAGMIISYDLASYNVVQSDHEYVTHFVREYADIVFANREEAAAFSGLESPEASLALMSGLTHVAVVKLGKDGATGTVSAPSGGTAGNGWAPSERATAPLNRNEKPVDTTAAGDFFAAGFLHGWSRGLPLATCLDYGNRIAGEVIRVVGTQVTAGALRCALLNSQCTHPEYCESRREE